MSHNYWSLPTLEHICLNYWAHVLQLLSLHAVTTEAHAPRDSAPQKEKPLQWKAQAQQKEQPPLAATRESPRKATKTHDSKKLTIF